MCKVAANYLLASKPQASNLQRVKDSSASSDMYSIMKYKEIGFSPGGISQKDYGTWKLIGGVLHDQDGAKNRNKKQWVRHII